MNHCAIFNGLNYDTGPCTILNIPAGLLAIAAAVILGAVIGHLVTR